MELKQLELEATEFTANGKRYLIKQTLSVERFRWYEKYQINFGYGRSFDNIHKSLEKSVDLANKGKGLEAWNIIFNLKDCIDKDLDKRAHQAFYLCALFICTEDEDLTKWEETLAERKIEDWNAEGIDAFSFFRIATNLVQGYLTALEGLSQDISQVNKVVEELKDLKQGLTT